MIWDVVVIVGEIYLIVDMTKSLREVKKRDNNQSHSQGNEPKGITLQLRSRLRLVTRYANLKRNLGNFKMSLSCKKMECVNKSLKLAGGITSQCLLRLIRDDFVNCVIYIFGKFFRRHKSNACKQPNIVLSRADVG